jgi:hypothetical protein
MGCVRAHIHRIRNLHRPFVAARRVGAEAMTTLVHKLARSMLAVQGIGSIWKLHSDAATLARIGNYAAALSLSEIAEAAERELLRQRSNTGGIAIGSK